MKIDYLSINYKKNIMYQLKELQKSLQNMDYSFKKISTKENIALIEISFFKKMPI